MCADFRKSEIDSYLRELSKELKKEFGRNSSFELILVGGASVLINYSFRDTTVDVDAFVSTQNSIKAAIRRVADRHNLPEDWMNSDFKYTDSFSTKLLQYSKYYKTFSQVLQVRTIKDEYLIAMKLMAFRSYKHDFSDIVGILKENPEITLESIYNAFKNLYGSLDKLTKEAEDFIENEIKNPSDIEKISNTEFINSSLLKEFDNEYKNVLNDDNVEDIINTFSKKSEKTDTPSKPRKMNLFQILL